MIEINYKLPAEGLGEPDVEAQGLFKYSDVFYLQLFKKYGREMAMVCISNEEYEIDVLEYNRLKVILQNYKE